MPGTGFGFPSYPQRPSLNPQDVGALLRRNVPQPPPGAPADATATNLPRRVGAAHAQYAVDAYNTAFPPAQPEVAYRAPRPDEAARDHAVASAGLSHAPAAPLSGLAAQQKLQGLGLRLSDASSDDTPIGGHPDVPSSLSIAAREATARGPAATRGTQRQPAAPGTVQQLLKMGLSPAEVQFLNIGGSVAE